MFRRAIGTEQNIVKRIESGEILVAVLRFDRVVQAMQMRTGEHRRESAKGDPQVRVDEESPQHQPGAYPGNCHRLLVKQ